MIKKVNVSNLRVGVYVHDFNYERQGGTLFIEKSVIKDEKTIEILEAMGINEVLIDTKKGLDAARPYSLNQRAQGADEAISQINQRNNSVQPLVPLAEEFPSARKITQDAVAMAQRSIQRAIEGKPPDVGATYNLVYRMKESLNRNKDALLLLNRIRNKDEYTLYHSFSVSSLVLNVCNYSHLSESAALDYAVGALFHDIGKTSVPQRILNKPGKLSKEEFREVQRHAEYSVSLLQEAKGLPLESYDIALHHHEKFNGSGYPDGLVVDKITYGSQLTGICDVFDAITSERSYKHAMDTVEGLRIIYDGIENLFEKDLAHEFIRCIGVYPVGTCIVLEDGRNGVVVGSTDNVMQPIVQVFYDENKKQRIKEQRIDLSRTGDTIASYSDSKKFGVTPSQLLRKIASRLIK